MKQILIKKEIVENFNKFQVIILKINLLLLNTKKIERFI